jgi:hypothetical protein
VYSFANGVQGPRIDNKKSVLWGSFTLQSDDRGYSPATHTFRQKIFATMDDTIASRNGVFFADTECENDGVRCVGDLALKIDTSEMPAYKDTSRQRKLKGEDGEDGEDSEDNEEEVLGDDDFAPMYIKPQWRAEVIYKDLHSY